jgi:uncharacterized protein
MCFCNWWAKGTSLLQVSEIQEESDQRVTVCVHKYDGVEHRRWQANLVQQRQSLIVLQGVFEGEVNHHLMGRIANGTTSIEYYWLNRYYNVFRLIEPSGEFRSFYCNISTPVQWTNNMLTYIDLDIDVLVEPDFSYRIIDLDDFEANAERLKYPDEIQRNAKESLAELVSLIEHRQFPFSEVWSAPAKRSGDGALDS